MTTDVQPLSDDDFWRTLRAPFPHEEVEKKPQTVYGKDIAKKRGKCREGQWVETSYGDRPVSMDEYYCGGSHTPAIHIDYIGHAGLTMRLNDVCTPAGWDWAPLSSTADGWPVIANGGMWIKLTITPPSGVAVSKLGFGDMGNSTGTQGVKEVIGDALRNAAMRFGIATYLWSKSERAKTAADVKDVPDPEPQQAVPEVPPVQVSVTRGPGPATYNVEAASQDGITSQAFREWLEKETPDLTDDQRRTMTLEAIGFEFNTGFATTSDTEWAILRDKWSSEGIPVPRGAK